MSMIDYNIISRSSKELLRTRILSTALTNKILHIPPCVSSHNSNILSCNQPSSSHSRTVFDAEFALNCHTWLSAEHLRLLLLLLLLRLVRQQATPDTLQFYDHEAATDESLRILGLGFGAPNPNADDGRFVSSDSAVHRVAPGLS
jgi:hypothetical protein